MATRSGGTSYSSRNGLSARTGGTGDVEIQIDPRFDFDSEVEGLSAHVRKIKQMSLAIEDERKQQGEIINNLESDRATELLAEEMERSSLAAAPAGVMASVDADGVPVVAVITPAGPVSMTRDEDFEACLEHALGLAAKEIDDIGEVVLEKMLLVMKRLTEKASEHHGDVTVIKDRKLEVVTATGPGESEVSMGCAAPCGRVSSGCQHPAGCRCLSGSIRLLEEATGRTSSIGQHTLCLDSLGTILNDTQFRTHTCGEYIQRASKVITLVDLAGHEKYFRTTAYGLTGHLPDYACLIIGANMGVVGMCKEHLGVALALKVPVFFVITKVDICPEHILKQTVTVLTSMLKKPGVRKKPFLVRSVDDVLLCARNMNADALAPIFLTSAVTGKGLELIRLFYNLLPQRHRWIDKQNDPAEFVIDETFGVPGVGTVVAGTVKRGTIFPNSLLLLGPDVADGSFKVAAIKSIQYKRLPVGMVVAGQTAALALKKIKRHQVRKGMVMVDERLKPVASWEFEADIAILTHSTTIQPRYQAVIHCEIIRQAARVVAMDKERLRSGDRACVRFRFIQRPEYVTIGTRFVFREGRTKGIGIVVGTEHEPFKGE
ncbi:MAG: hypothetical protein WDW38_000979 [Sanguina aurantia]